MIECYGKCGDKRDHENAKPYWCRPCKKKFNAYLGPRITGDYWAVELQGLKEKVYSDKLAKGFSILHACGDRK
jgi:hypothetical protein